jgi:tetratricopeptide (TPR) repeat protein
MAALLVLVTLVLYWPVTGHGFVAFDDHAYVTENSHVQAGLSWEGVKWAFSNPVCCNWHPVTVLSHMLDCQAFGLNPWGHHLTSLLLHAVNAMLVFWLLQQMTGARWRSLLVAALFALHPLRVESVAWVAERKDVLSGFFGLLALMAYARYAQRSVISNQWSVIGHRPSGVPAPHNGPRPTDHRLPITDHGLLFYLLSLFFLALGLMSKPMLVTWPFVMLLLDYWPLKRIKPKRAWRLVAEKIPFFALSAAVTVTTFVVQRQGGAVRLVEYLPLSERCANALVSYGRYLGKLLWPANLAVFYPHPGEWPTGKVVLGGGLVVGLLVLFWLKRRQCPYLLMGWLWFLGTLVPVIGLVQVRSQAMADRYSYIPSLGVMIVAVWGAYALTRDWRYQALAWWLGGGAAIIVCLALTRQQIGYWESNEALFGHALEATDDNYLAHKAFGDALDEKNETDEARKHYLEAIRLKPGYPEPYNNLGDMLAKEGRLNDAIHQFQEALRLNPHFADAHYNLGNTLLKGGQTSEAIRQYEEAIRLNPDYTEAHNNLGAALNGQGRIDEAIRQYREVIRLKPADAGPHNNLGLALSRTGQIDEAIRQYREALRLKPDYAEAQSNLARALGMKNASPDR